MSKAKEILSQLQAYYHKIENEQFSPNDLEEMVRLSRELHERSVILRYKSFEQKVFDKKNIVETVEAIEEKVVEQKEAVQEIDFGIFEEEVKPEAAVESELIEEPEMTPAFDFDSDVEEEDVEEETGEFVEEIAEVEVEIEPELIEEEAEEIAVEEKQEPIISQNSKENSGSGPWHGFFGKIAQEKHSGFISSINSLSGSFGLNERLLYINELFDSNAEAFSEGIHNLDGCADWSTCMDAMDGLATSMNWNQENETVAEFVGHVYRKYA